MSARQAAQQSGLWRLEIECSHPTTSQLGVREVPKGLTEGLSSPRISAHSKADSAIPTFDTFEDRLTANLSRVTLNHPFLHTGLGLLLACRDLIDVAD